MDAKKRAAAAKAKRAAIESLTALGYWDFEVIKSALDLAAHYLTEHSIDYAITTPEGCRRIKKKMEDLAEKTARLF